MRSHFRPFIAGTSGARRVWLFTLVLTALTVCLALVLVPSEPPIPLPFRSRSGDRGRLLPGRGEGHPPPHRAERPLVLDERAPARRRAVPRLATGIHRRAGDRLGPRPLLQPAPALGEASVQPRPVRPGLGRLGRRSSMRQCRPRPFGPSLWTAVLVVALVENVIGVLSVSTAISLAEGTAQYRRIPEMLKIGIVVSLTNASLALMGLAVLWANPGSAWLFVLPTITAALAYRAYISERQQHREHRAALRVDPDPPAQPATRYRDRVAARSCPKDVPGRRGRDPAAAPP